MKGQLEVELCDICKKEQADTKCLACHNKGMETWVGENHATGIALSDKTGSVGGRLCPKHAAQVQKAIGMI